MSPGEDSVSDRNPGTSPESTPASEPAVLELGDMLVSPTAALFQGDEHAPGLGVDSSMFVTRTPPGVFVELHVHPYPETFVLLAGRGRWTSGESVVELEPDGDGTALRLTHSGFVSERSRDGHAENWPLALECLEAALRERE